jgi:ankyrin repeat protein
MPTSSRARTSFWRSALNGDLPALERALAQGARHDEPARILDAEGRDISTSFPTWGSALLGATAGGKFNIMRRLLALGADPGRANPDGSGLLLLALRSGSPECIHLAFEADPLPARSNAHGIDALMAAAQGAPAAIIHRLIALGLDPRKADQRGQSALHFACISSATNACRALLDAGALVDARDQTGMTPFMLAISRNNHETLDLLVSRGADINAANRHGDSSLHLLMRRKASHGVEFLIAHGAATEIRNHDGSTALGNACQHGWAHHIAALCAAGADFSSPGPHGQSGFHLIIKSSPFFQAAESGIALALAGADPNARDEQGFSPLDRASTLSGRLIQSVARWGGDPNLAHPHTGMTPLDCITLRHGHEQHFVDAHAVAALFHCGSRPSALLMAAFALRSNTDTEPPNGMRQVWERCRIEHERQQLELNSAGASAASRKRSL